MPYKDKVKEAAYLERTKARRAMMARERYANNPKSRQARLDGNRISQIKSKYGITLEDRAEILDGQGGLCAICQTDTPPTKSGWHVDHCHRTKVVRGILCQHCNNMLGMAKDNVKILQRAIQYLDGELK